MLLSGARPVPPPTSSSGDASPVSAVEAIRRGALRDQQRAPRISSANTCSENSPPGARRTCSSSGPGIVRRRGDGEAAPPAFGQHDVDVLSRLEFETLGGRKPQVNSDHVVPEPLDALDAARQALDAQRPSVPRANISSSRSLRACARQSRTSPSDGLVIRQAERPAVRIPHLALESRARHAPQLPPWQRCGTSSPGRAERHRAPSRSAAVSNASGRSEQLDAQLPAPSRPSYYVDASRAARVAASRRLTASAMLAACASSS